jgi:DNA-binding transcriptional regulator YhcF (GntR family)
MGNMIHNSGKEVNAERFYKLPEDLMKRRDLTLTAKVIFAVLLRRQGDNGEAWPGYERLADDAGISKMSAIRATQELEKNGLIEVTIRGGGMKKTNHYKLPETVTNCDSLEPKTVTKSDSKQSQNVTEKGNKLLLETVTNCDRNRDIQERQSRESLKNKHDNSFERFWSAYPRKIAKTAAMKAWKKIKPSPELITTILTAVNIQRESDQWTKDSGMFIPYPATWLNQERWLDEVQITKGAYIPAKPSKGQDINGLVMNFGNKEPA